MRLEIHHINVSQGDATLIIHRNLDKLKNKIESKLTPPTDAKQLMPFAIKHGIDLEGTVECAILLDAAEGTYGADVFEYMQKYGVKGAETQKKFYTLITHYHSDHMGGIDSIYNKQGQTFATNKQDIVENYPPAITYDIGDDEKFDPDTRVFSSYFEDLHQTTRYTIKRKVLGLGETVDLGTGINKTQIQLRCLATNRNVLKVGPVTPQYKADQNARSLVVILEYGPFRYFLGGDIGGTGNKDGGNVGENADSRDKKGFQKLVSSHDDIESSIRAALINQYPEVGGRPPGHICGFKANHHGSASSNDVYLLATMRPKIVLISSGAKDTFHAHPTQEVLNRIDKAKSREWVNHRNTKIANSIENYYITEMAADTTKKKFTRDLPNGRIVGDIIVRPYEPDIENDGKRGIRMHVYGSGVRAAVGEGFMALRPAIKSDPLNPDADNGPWEHKCDLH
jgi:beta-lactamase superfamily II metal-dependent hydrolase